MSLQSRANPIVEYFLGVMWKAVHAAAAFMSDIFGYFFQFLVESHLGELVARLAGLVGLGFAVLWVPASVLLAVLRPGGRALSEAIIYYLLAPVLFLVKHGIRWLWSGVIVNLLVTLAELTKINAVFLFKLGEVGLLMLRFDLAMNALLRMVGARNLSTPAPPLGYAAQPADAPALHEKVAGATTDLFTGYAETSVNFVQRLLSSG